MLNDYLEHKLTDSQLALIDIWFIDHSHELYLIGESKEQQILLKQIQNIAEIYGAINLNHAVFCMKINSEIKELFNAVREISETLQNIKLETEHQ